MAPLIESIDFARFGRAPARFDLDELKALNARTIHLTEYEAVAARLPDGMDARIWNAVRPNIATVAEAADWLPVVNGDIAPPAFEPDDKAYLALAATAAADMAWAEDAWQTLTAALKASTGRKGRTLFLPLRQALTARDHGPDMAALLPLIGRDRTVARLEAAAAA
jgi:glutamyl-tRNA synthetase